MIEKLKPRSVNPPATNDQIARLESRIGQQIPDRLRALLGESNGVWAGDLQILDEACPGGILANMFYSTEDMEENLQVYGARISDDLLAFANDQCGNQICIGIKGPRLGKVYFWDHDEDVVGCLEMGFDVDPSAIHQNECFVADSLDEFISLFVDWDVGGDPSSAPQIGP